MEEQDLIDLGFERFEEETMGDPFYYYTKDLSNGTISLITPSHDEVVDGGWFVEVFQDENIQFTELEELQEFINIVERNMIDIDEESGENA